MKGWRVRERFIGLILFCSIKVDSFLFNQMHTFYYEYGAIVMTIIDKKERKRLKISPFFVCLFVCFFLSFYRPLILSAFSILYILFFLSSIPLLFLHFTSSVLEISLLCKVCIFCINSNVAGSEPVKRSKEGNKVKESGRNMDKDRDERKRNRIKEMVIE